MRDEQIAQEVLICIGTNKTLQDESRFRLGSEQFYLKSAAQMREAFRDMPEACDRTLEIADRVQIKFKLKDDKGKPIYHLPSFPTREGATITDEIRAQSLEGLEKRFAEIKALGAQAWMTGTDLSLFEAAHCQIFEVRDGVFISQGGV